MRLTHLILLCIIGPSPFASYAGTLVGDWYQEGLEDTANAKRRAYSQPISPSTETTQVTLGIKSPGLVDSVDFYLIISGKTTALNCLYAVKEIAIDSKHFPVKSTTHSSDISQVLTRTDDDQQNLWREFRKGQNLSLKIHQTCSDQNEQTSEESTYDFSLKGSSAAYKFVTRDEVAQTRIQENMKVEEPARTTASKSFEEDLEDDSGDSTYFALLIAFIVVVLIIIHSKRQAKPLHTNSTLKPGDKGLAPLKREHIRARSDAGKVSQGFHINREPERAPVHGYDQEISNFPEFRVEHVIDGDTVIVSTHKKKHKIRLDSIDCPEDGQEWGNNATAGLIKLIGGKRVYVEEHTTDHYDRMVATLYVYDEKDSEWVNVNEKMVMRGHAWVMRKYYNHLPEYRQIKLNRLERWARSKKVGLWRLPNPVPPWNWRRGNSYN